MKRMLFLVYGVLCHLMFLAVFAYLAGFLADLSFLPKTVDSGAAGTRGTALAVNLSLLLLFGVSHSVMARPTFKRWWTRIVPTEIERSTYVLVSNLVMMFLLWQWRPLEGAVWSVQAGGLQALLWSLCAAGWLLIVLASFLINHFDLFGTRHVWLYFRGREYTPPRFGMPLLYRVVRHPLYVGWLLAFWVTPHMTLGHFVFTLGTTAYILVAIVFEERNLVEEHPEYEHYRRTTPMLVPFTKPGSPARGRLPESSAS